MVDIVNGRIARERETIMIKCNAVGYPPPTVVWNRINGILSDRVSVSDSISVPNGYGNVTRVSVNLIITNVSREDTGVYTCSANNSIGSDSSNVNITVQCKYLIMYFSLTIMIRPSILSCINPMKQVIILISKNQALQILYLKHHVYKTS